jgi:Zn-dependent protease
MSAFKAAFIVLVLSFSAHAGAVVNIWATDQACPVLKPAAVEIARVPFPPGWIVLVTCNEVQWVRLQRKADAQGTHYAFTNVDGRITVVRGTIFVRGLDRRSAHRVLLHEIGHIRCDCDDEAKAEAWAAANEHVPTNGTR